MNFYILFNISASGRSFDACGVGIKRQYFKQINVHVLLVASLRTRIKVNMPYRLGQIVRHFGYT